MTVRPIVFGQQARFAPSRPWGWRWSRISTAAIRATPIGLGGYGYVPVQRGDDDILIVRSNSTHDVTLTTSGANGLHDDYSEAADTGYDIYWAVGHEEALEPFAVPTGETIVSGTSGAGEASIDDLDGGGFYTHWSQVSWFVRNDGSSDIKPFTQLWEGAWQYEPNETDPIPPLNFTSTTKTAVNWTGWAPANDTGAVAHYCKLHNASTSVLRVVTLYRTASSTRWLDETLYLGNFAGRVELFRGYRPLIGVAGLSLATPYYAAWIPSGGADADFYPGVVVLS